MNSDSTYSLFSIFQLLIGVYLLYSAITGKGQLFRNENVKKGKEALYHKRLRIMAAVIAPLMFIQAAIDYFTPGAAAEMQPALRTAGIASYIVTLAAVVVLIVISVRLTDRAKAGAPKGKGVSRAAFEFDEEESGKTE
ncbi:hypothetical protein LJC27_06885 [Christensenellaceae bacterium OttesenSCG-928-M15]|nr:hypothetical protein [Christensenellaceae bacterium OttesenSCG-928-M15]